MYTVSMFVEQFSVSACAIHYYAEIGILSPTRDSDGCRQFSEMDEKRLRFLISAMQLGFSLNDIQVMLGIVESENEVTSLVLKLIKCRIDELHNSFENNPLQLERMKATKRLWDLFSGNPPSERSILRLINIWEVPGAFNDELQILPTSSK